MLDSFTQRVVLIGRVIEDLSYQPLALDRFRVELVGHSRTPHYKPGGFFVFTDLPADQYAVRISGHDYQPALLTVTIPASATPSVVNQPAADDLVVVVRALNNGSSRIVFDPVFLPQPIRAGAQVIADGTETTLRIALESGRVAEARLESIVGLAVDSIVRIVRDKSIRMKFGPYYRFPSPITRIMGKITRDDALATALPGVTVRVTAVNGSPVGEEDAGGVVFVTVVDGKKTILGSADDVATVTNAEGRYHLYFPRADFLESVTLTMLLGGYQTRSALVAITGNRHHELNVSLSRV